jgi:NADPH:quinone reductase-like Zn-dependent oxidoreductase
MASGVLRPPPPTLFALRDARQAHTLLDAGQTLGKMVLLPQR